MRPAVRTLLTVGLGASLVLPLGVLAVWSVSLRWYYPALVPQSLDTRAWTDLLDVTSPVWSAVRGSVLVGGLTALLATLAALPAARRLSRESGRARRALTFVMLAPLLLPAFASVMGIHVVFLWLGVADTPLGVVLAHLIPATPYAVLLLTGTFERYDGRYEEVARTLGASARRVTWHVTLPLVRPGLVVAALLAFLVSWSEYLLTLIVGGGQVSTLPLLLLASAQGGDAARTAVLSLIYVAPALVLFALAARTLRGWSA